MDIARIVGADEKHDGYMSGNGYMVTWALGHLVSLALPGYYGYSRPSATSLPLLPAPFQLVIRRRKTTKGMDAGREGENIFRYIYSYLGYTKPFKRLWISSLTDEAITKGLANLKDGRAYDNLYIAADCRAKADWLIGMNASMALAISSGIENNSLGRVQTPTLAMICSRYLENKNFISTNYWQLHITLEKEGQFRRFHYTENIQEKEDAEKLYTCLKSHLSAQITTIKRKIVYQTQPLLYDLTTLQKDATFTLISPPKTHWK